MPGPYETLIELENEACVKYPQEARYRIDFDGNKQPLRVIRPADPELPFTYRRGGLDLTRDQCADLIRRNLNLQPRMSDVTQS